MARQFSLYDIEHFIREAGAERVTEDAVERLEKELERLAEALTKRSITYAKHAGRNTLIKKSDVLLARSADQKWGTKILMANARRTKANSRAER
ncbi:MAG: NFYB/HAP3 family transcription factor subunit [Candidatus Micrarchaeaceae archaeon]